MNYRIPIKLTDTMMETMTKMSEGNPGALRVLMELFTSENWLPILGLDDMNIRGWQVWVGYKDYCKCDLDLFVKKIKERSSEMVDVINDEARRMDSSLLAVTRGASFPEGS